MTAAPAQTATPPWAAGWYARRGYHVFALGERAKTPATEHGVHDATSDLVAIEAMWSASPTRNVAIATGAASGVIVVDVDGPDGEASLAALEAQQEPLPLTAAVQTGRGRHLYFAAPSGATIRNSAGRLGPGLDVRGDGGYVVAPPSVHPSGARYRWLDGQRIDEIAPAPMPEWLVDRLIDRPPPRVVTPPPSAATADAYARAALERESGAVATAQPGARNARLNEAAYALGQLVAGGALSEHDVHTALMAAARGCGLGEREAERTVASGMAAGAKQPRTPPERHAADGGPRTTDAAVPETWPDPTELPGLPPVPEWNDALLPDALRPLLSDVSERTQCPPEYVAVGALVSLASVIGRGCGIRPKQRDDWTVVPNLWGAIVGPPSAMKTPALSEALRPLKAVAAAASEQHARQAGQREELEARLLAAKKALHAAAAKGEDTSELRDRYQVLLQLTAAAVRERRYIVHDTTTEKLGEILNASPRGVLLCRDELSGWLASLDRQGHEGDRAFFLETWNGTGEFVYDRIGRGTIKIEAACVSIVGGIQPGPLGRYLRDAISGGAGADGLMQRFQLLVYPDPPSTWRTVDRWPASDARQQAVELYRRLAELTPDDIGADSSDGVPFVRFDREAQAFFDGWLADLMTRARSGTEHGAIEGHLVKYASLMPSLALVFHFADAGSAPVGLTAAQRGAAWCALLEAHARRVYATVTDAAADGARALLAKLRAGKLRNPFRAQDAYLPGWTGLATPDDAHRAIELLERHGYVRQVQIQTPGRPRTDVHVHPTLTRKEAAE